MVKELKRMLLVVVITAIILVVFINISGKVNAISSENADLVVFGENVDPKNKPFVENNAVYISTDTIGKLIDEHIFYDKVATKVIITTEDKVIKMKIDENKMSENMNYVDITNPAKVVNGQPYVDINLLKEIYSIKVEYNSDTNTISIDKKDTSDLGIKYNNVNVYSDLTTKSDILENIGRKNTVTVYTESLKHNRWYKVKTDSGIIGYISKNNVEIITDEEEKTESDNNIELNSQEKLTMFWQYGSDLDVLGTTTIDGIDVVSPTWYELKNSNGEISSKFSQSYYNQAKSLGYEIWPIITNGIDSASYTASDTSAMLNSEQSREQFIKNLLSIAKENGLHGINIDFEAMKTEDRDMYTQLIRELVPILRENNIKVSVDMYFVAYIDRKEVGNAADYVVLMGYDQRGAWSNEAGSIAEVSWVEGNLKSLINDSNIPSNKIILAVPFYTRLWTIKDGEEKPTTKVYTMKNCQDFLTTYKVTPVLDQDAGQNYAEYKEGSLTYKLWLEDADSIKRRVELVSKYNLAGITGWRKGFETDDIWQVIKDNLK